MFKLNFDKVIVELNPGRQDIIVVHLSNLDLDEDEAPPRLVMARPRGTACAWVRENLGVDPEVVRRATPYDAVRQFAVTDLNEWSKQRDSALVTPRHKPIFTLK